MNSLWLGLILLAIYLAGMFLMYATLSYAKGCRRRQVTKDGTLRYWKYWHEGDWTAGVFMGAIFWPTVPAIIALFFAGKAVGKAFTFLEESVFLPIGEWFEKLGEDKGCGK